MTSFRALILPALLLLPTAAMAEPGPNCREVVQASSADGMNFTPQGGVVLDQASSPDGISSAEGTYLYYVNGNFNDHGIWRAKEQGDGSWGTGARVMLNAHFIADAVDPDVTLMPDGNYRLYYFLDNITGTSPSEDGKSRIYGANSSDGLNFVISGVALETEGGRAPSTVLLKDGFLVMAVAQPEKGKIIISRSGDTGLKFEPTGVELDGGEPTLVLMPDGAIRLYHDGKAGLLPSYVSRDGGLTWTPETALHLQGGGAPDVTQMSGGGFRLFHTRTKPGCTTPEGAYLLDSTGRAAGPGGRTDTAGTGLGVGKSEFDWTVFTNLPEKTAACMGRYLNKKEMAALGTGEKPNDKRLHQKSRQVYWLCSR